MAAASCTRWPKRRLSIGFVVGLDYQDPLFDPHAAFQRFKLHPFIKGILDGGHMQRYGAKALPEGGWRTQPRLYVDGGLIVGDSANFVNSLRLKGIHLAMRSGMLAAETAFDGASRRRHLGRDAVQVQDPGGRERHQDRALSRSATSTRRSRTA